MVGAVHVLAPTFNIPFVAAKYVSFWFAAEELVLPQVPETVPPPPSIRLPTEMVKPVPMFAEAPVIDNAPVTEVPVEIDFAPLPEKVRLL